MITRAIVEEVISPHKVKIRVPLLDRVSSSSLSTKTRNLNTATICTLPNCYMNIHVGDVVFIAFEDNTSDRAVVLGHLSRDLPYESFAQLVLSTLAVNDDASLPASTSIGDVTSKEIYCLSGVKGSIQMQLNLLNDKIQKLLDAVFPPPEDKE